MELNRKIVNVLTSIGAVITFILLIIPQVIDVIQANPGANWKQLIWQCGVVVLLALKGLKYKQDS